MEVESELIKALTPDGLRTLKRFWFPPPRRIGLRVVSKVR